jgi:hypothetical protein
MRYGGDIDVQDSAASRRTLLRRGVAGAGALAAGGGLLRFAGRAAAAPSKAQDAKIFNLALLLEYTEDAFYAEALRRGKLTGKLREYAQTVHTQDRQHLAVLKLQLGPKAAARPSFQFGQSTQSPKAFTATAIKLEDLAVAAYNGQAGNLTKPALAAAAAIVSVEARHAAWIRAINDLVAAPDAVDKPATAAEVARGLREIGMR